jgi:hypothetical protein
MKNISKNIISSAVVLTAVSLLMPAAGMAQVVLGSWQDTDGDGWSDWNGGSPVSITTLPAKYGYASGAVSGYAQSLEITQTGYNQGLTLQLQNTGFVDDFVNNNQLSFTFSVPAAADSGSTGGYSQLFEFVINSPAGFNAVSWSSGLWSYSGDTSNNQNGQPNYYFYDGAPARSQTVTLDYTSLKPAIGSNPGWLEFIFTFNNGDGAPDNFYMNEVVLVPEPSSLALLGLAGFGFLVARRQSKL